MISISTSSSSGKLSSIEKNEHDFLDS
jgi:hypothetical protein